MYGVMLNTTRPPPGTLPDFVSHLLSCFAAHHHSEILFLLAHVVQVCALPELGSADNGGGVAPGADAPLQQCLRGVVEASQPLFTAASSMYGSVS